VIHSRAFQEEERQYPGFDELREKLRLLCHRAQPKGKGATSRTNSRSRGK
jgi:hypothetical protein